MTSVATLWFIVIALSLSLIPHRKNTNVGNVCFDQIPDIGKDSHDFLVIIGNDGLDGISFSVNGLRGCVHESCTLISKS